MLCNSISTFFHELTHLLDYNYFGFQLLEEYDLFKERFFANPNNSGLIIQFLELWQKKKSNLAMQIINEIKMEKIFDIKNNTDLKTTQNNQQYLIINQLDIISLIEDIIDSIYDGRSYSQGLVYIENSNSYPLKAEKTAGHGCEYFRIPVINLKKYWLIT